MKHWHKIMAQKSDKELSDIISNPGNLEEEIVQAAKAEFDERMNSVERVVFPNKPEYNEVQRSVKNASISMLVFIFAFYFVFKWPLAHVLYLVGVVLIHEMGHFLMMKAFNYKDISIFFMPLLGAFTTGDKEDANQLQRVLVLLAGPIPGILFGLFFFYLGNKVGKSDYLRLADIFIYLNLFNLVPIMPLDGGKLIKVLFIKKNEIINILFVGVSVVLLAIMAFYSRSYFLMVIPFFLVMQIVNQVQVLKVKKYLRSVNINYQKKMSDLSNEEYWKIRDALALTIGSYKKLIRPGKYELSPFEPRIFKNIKEIVQLPPQRNLGFIGSIVVVIVWISAFLIPLSIISAYLVKTGQIKL